MTLCDEPPWGLADGLTCTGIGDPHAHVFTASSVGDKHDQADSDARLDER